MGKIDIFPNGSVAFRKSSVTLRYTLYRLQLAQAVGECILRRGRSDMPFPNYFWQDLII